MFAPGQIRFKLAPLRQPPSSLNISPYSTASEPSDNHKEHPKKSMAEMPIHSVSNPAQRTPEGLSSRVCSIYLRDVFSLLPRVEMNKCHGVSGHCQAAFLQCPVGIRPRYHAYVLKFDSVSNGFLAGFGPFRCLIRHHPIISVQPPFPGVRLGQPARRLRGREQVHHAG